MRQTVWAFAFFLVALLAGGTSTAQEPAKSHSPSAVGAQARAPTAWERRRLFVGVVGFAALAFGLAGLWLMRRKRVHPDLTGEPAEPPRSEAQAPAASEPAPSAKAAQAMMSCPTCREEYPIDARFCKNDGNRLVAVREGTDQRGPTGGICPVCGQGFDPGVPLCPVHHEELVPAQLYISGHRASGSYPKICPTCGVHYPTGSDFCGADGSALVTVN